MTKIPVKTIRSCCGGTAAAQVVEAPPGPMDGRFELIDHFGRPVNERSFGERHLLIFFGFSHCEVVCPRELEKLGTAVERLGPLAQRVQPLYITVDPQRDDPQTMRAYVARYPGNFMGLTGTPAQVVATKKAYRVFAEPVPAANASDGYVVPHTALAYLMAPGGRYKTHFPDALNVDSVVDRLRQHLG